MNPPPTRPLQVLVLDDREESRYLMATWLRRAGFEVVEASTGADALALLDRDRFDVALLDVNLPDMSGFEICERIRADPRTAAMGVVHVSATAVNPGDRFEGLLRGADAYLLEPLEASDLLGTVTAIVRRVGVRETIELTAHRLRALNRSSTDVQAASDDVQVYDAALAGMVDIAGDDAVLIRSDGPRAFMSRWMDGARAEQRIATETFRELMAPAIAGVTVLRVDAGMLADGPMVGAPFVDETGEPAGALLVSADISAAEFEVVPLLAQLAVTLSLARANLNALAIEHRVALVFQQSLLPAEPPVVTGGVIHFHYAASSRHSEVGGDFYEAVPLDDSHVLLAIGDVVGHSLRAATVMGELRYAIRAYALEDYTPDQIVVRLDRLIRRFHPSWYTTLLCGLLDLGTGAFRFCNAGHPPPLIVRRDGSAEYLEEHGVLMGLDQPPPPLVAAHLDHGERLVLVTDGLVERAGEDLTDGFRRLREGAIATRSVDPARAITDLVATVGPLDVPTDDLALLLVDRH